MMVDDEEKVKGSEKEDELKEVSKKKIEKSAVSPGKLRRQYSDTILYALRESPFVKKRPDCLSAEYCDETGTWDPEIWHAAFSGKGPRAPSPAFPQEIKLGRKLSDAKERLKEEQDGIILSPQRRSFGHGCQITFPQPSPLTTSNKPRPRSPIDKDFRESIHRDSSGPRSVPGRRRVITRPVRDAKQIEREREREHGQRQHNNIFDRFSYGEDRFRDGYGSRRPKRYHEEPEWFLDAPTTLETMELRGFDDRDDGEEEDEREVRHKKERGGPTVADRNGSMETAVSSSVGSSLSEDAGTNPGSATNPNPSKEFDINMFFKFADAIPIVASPEEEPTLGKSRFSHLFTSIASQGDNRSRSNSMGSNSRSTSRRSSLQKDEIDFLQGLDMRGSGSDTDTVSTPIRTLIEDTLAPNPKSLLEMLQKGPLEAENSGMSSKQIQQKMVDGEVKSLSEIEAELKGMVIQKSRAKQERKMIARGGSPVDSFVAQDQTAFNKFIASFGSSAETPQESPRQKPSVHPMASSSPYKSPSTAAKRPPPQSALFQNGQLPATQHQAAPHTHQPHPTMQPLMQQHESRFQMFTDPEENKTRGQSRQSPEMMFFNNLQQGNQADEAQNRSSPINQEVLMNMLKLTGGLTPNNDDLAHMQRQSPTAHAQLVGLIHRQLSAPDPQAQQQLHQQQLLQQQQHAHQTQPNQEIVTALVRHAATNPALAAALMQRGLLPNMDPSGRGVGRPTSPQELRAHTFLQQQAAQRGHSPLGTSPLGIPGQQSPLNPSPLPPGVSPPVGASGTHLLPPSQMGVAIPPGAHQPSPIKPRIPSPQELVKHTQSILQQALIKRQLEVQREKFMARERDTHNRSKSPGPQQRRGSGSSIAGRTPPNTPTSRQPSVVLATAFTPTSVIRKMHETKAEAKAAEGMKEEKLETDSQSRPEQMIGPLNGGISDHTQNIHLQQQLQKDGHSGDVMNHVLSTVRRNDQQLDVTSPSKMDQSPARLRISPATPLQFVNQSPARQLESTPQRVMDQSPARLGLSLAKPSEFVNQSPTRSSESTPQRQMDQSSARLGLSPARPLQFVNQSPARQLESTPQRKMDSSVVRPHVAPLLSPNKDMLRTFEIESHSLSKVQDMDRGDSSNISANTKKEESKSLVDDGMAKALVNGPDIKSNHLDQKHFNQGIDANVPKSPSKQRQVPQLNSFINHQNMEGPKHDNHLINNYHRMDPSQIRTFVRIPNQQHMAQQPQAMRPQPPQQPQAMRPQPPQQPPSPLMQQARPGMPSQPTFPLMPGQRLHTPMGLMPLAQQNLMRGMMMNMPPPRPPTIQGMNPLAIMAMQMNPRPGIPQMASPTQISPTAPQGPAGPRQMLPPTFHTQNPQGLRPGTMGLPMMPQRPLTPGHSQMPRMPKQPHQDWSVQNDMHRQQQQLSMPTSGMFIGPSAHALTASLPSPGGAEARRSPVNPLAKWFGNDLLKQSHTQSSPAVPDGLRVLSLEELERQQQVVG